MHGSGIHVWRARNAVHTGRRGWESPPAARISRQTLASSRPSVTILPTLGARTRAQLADALAGLDVALSADEVATLEAVSNPVFREIDRKGNGKAKPMASECYGSALLRYVDLVSAIGDGRLGARIPRPRKELRRRSMVSPSKRSALAGAADESKNAI
jgi:hypothetical protein